MPAVPTGETHCATLRLRHAQFYGREFSSHPSGRGVIINTESQEAQRPRLRRAELGTWNLELGTSRHRASRRLASRATTGMHLRF